MRILLSNDDGVGAPGLRALAAALRSMGEVWVVAPEVDQSAISHALTLHAPLRVRRVRRGWYAVNGTPTDCVDMGIHRVLGGERPGLVVAGINAGENLGEDVIYSGTVSAAMEGTLHGVPSMAVSLVGRSGFRYRVAARLALELARYVLHRGLPANTFLNVNIPNVRPEELRGVRLTRQGRRLPGNSIMEMVDPRGEKHYWIGANLASWEEGEDTDFYAVDHSYVSVTPLTIDFTDYSTLEVLRRDPPRVGLSGSGE